MKEKPLSFCFLVHRRYYLFDITTAVSTSDERSLFFVTAK